MTQQERMAQPFVSVYFFVRRDLGNFQFHDFRAKFVAEKLKRARNNHAPQCLIQAGM
jgi:hypothetical protein